MSAKAAIWLVLLLCAGVSAEPAPPVALQPPPPQPAPANLASTRPVTPPAMALLPKLTDQLIRDAVRDTLAEAPENPRRYEADTIRGNSYDEFSQRFSEARLPDCLHSEGLKRQPTFFLRGFLALPFIAVAKLRGVCR